MRKILVIIFSLFLLVFPQAIKAQSNINNSYVITEFHSDIFVEQDTSLTIVETLTYNFPLPKHGIYRVIPTIYSARGKTINAKLKVISVEDENGKSYEYETSRLRQSVKLKIGDADKTVDGLNTYVITYKMSNVLRRFDRHDELYWNVTGSEWDTEILATSAEVESPYAKVIKVDCFSGEFGKKTKNCVSEYRDNSAEFVSTSTLGPGRDLTIIVGLEKDNQLIFPGFFEKLKDSIFDNWGYAVAILPAVLMFLLWNKRGRDKRYLSDMIYYKPDNVQAKTVALFARKHIPLVYHPIDGLSPSEVGTIVDEKVDIHDVVAEMVEMARLGFFKIRKIEHKKLVRKNVEYVFIKEPRFADKKELAKLKGYQRYLIKEIFRSNVIHKSVSAAEKLFKGNDEKLAEVRELLVKEEYVLLSALKNHFYEGLPTFKDKLYKRMKNEGFFAGNPEKTRNKWIGIFLLINSIAIVIMVYFVTTTSNFFPMVMLVFGFVPTLILAMSMPRRTPKGYSLYRQIEGLKWYLSKGKWRYEVHEKRMFVEEILPLAIALGVVNKLAKDMKELEIRPPSYFAGSTWVAFSRDIGLFNKSTQGAFLSASGGKWTGKASWSGGSGFSGGGCFSGGGFGGGGGGSW